MKTALVAFALAATVATAQQSPYFETYEVRLHNLDVVVTDAKGNPVHGLNEANFEVFEDGKPQAITNFSTYDVQTATPRSSEEPRNAEGLARRFVFFVDDMGIQTYARRALVREATALVDQLQPGDLAAVVRPTGEQRIVQDYTTDHAAVRRTLADAIESCKLDGDAPGFQELREFRHSMEIARDRLDEMHARSRYTEQARQRVQQRLAQLRALVGSLSRIEGRNVLVLLTSGISSSPGRDATDLEDQMRLGSDRLITEWGAPGADFQPVIDELARTAAANGVTIYALEPEVPLWTVPMKSAAARPTGATRAPGGVALNNGLSASAANIVPRYFFEELQHYRAQTLTSLAEKTGGKWFRGIGTIDDVFRQVSSDLSVYYSLAYRATGEANRPRRVAVRIKNRPELQTRTRSEVIDRSPEREMGDLTTANLLYPRELNELDVTVTSGDPKADGKLFDVPVEIAMPLEKLTFVQTAGDMYAAAIDVHFAASGKTNDYTTIGKHRQNIEITPEQHAALDGTTYRFRTGIQIPKGEARIAIGVMDAASHLAGVRNVDVVAP